MNKEQAQQLLIKYQSDLCTPEEKALVERWYLNEYSRQPMPDAPDDPLLVEQTIWDRILDELPDEGKVRHLRKWYAFAAAAIVLIFLSAGLYFALHKAVTVNHLVSNRPLKNDIAPGGNRAILTLANGKQINLTTAQNGKIAEQGAVAVKKTADGRIVYDLSGDLASVDKTGNVAFNTIATPRGGQYWVVLPDGSKVLLNAASSLTYPTVFTGKARKVELTGEAYFEVAHNAAKPFKVSSNGQTVEVLGTHFNINAYNDEPTIRTTLLEGAVRISKGNKTALLKPGDQAQLAPGVSDSEITITQVDTEGAVAWKNGLFVFDGYRIEQIMRMISRWYNVDVVYSGAVSDDIFGGSVPRLSNVSEVLKTLQLTGKAHFKMADGKIIVSK